ncbi:hypothetical protein Q669_29565 [Labrenzia sp. C1B10]|uniref:dATP/dGTP pyrophosphohydrolase domain-containing protein n=1 Tax=unclassified Labrenzia TaxID=2648686 RepID=UPI0003B88C14|nr:MULTISPECIES: dATP/dGTP pyrophosphohydrolase domain-containing protein [unclassified Labrenzia]ERP95719.1 hypothetical protein Q669_29565 [Labrenzia sp. C1B10]ERS05785.1 hypothetical protein Q675_29130 [Labrenzia sp. C1B70]
MDFFELSPQLVTRHRKWSDATFGPRSERGPISSLKHLKKEVDEALNDPHEVEEYADMMFLLLDAAHRAGFDCFDVHGAMVDKLPVLLKRDYPKTAPEEVSEHIRK